jgi:hypothetical protein
MAALNLQDPAAKASAMESFAAKYPLSVVYQDSLEQAMAAYQAAGDQAKVEEKAHEVLQLDPQNVRALAISVSIDRAKATQGDKDTLKTLLAESQKGLSYLGTWKKPDGMSDDDFSKLRRQVIEVFNGAAGFSELQAHQNAAARKHLTKAVDIDPASLQDVYQLSIAELEVKPLDPMGFWHIARALQLAGGNGPTRESIEKYGKAKYKKYHGSDTGWDDLVKNAADKTSVPAGFAKSITPAKE